MLMLEDAKGRHREQEAVERVARFTPSELNCGSAFYAGARVALRGAKRVEPPVQRRAWQTKPEMPPSQQPARINLQDLKAQIVKRIGPDKASQYFAYFKGFISLKLKKPELDKLVLLTIGKENVSLHNQLVRAVLNNAIRSELPPPSPLVQDTSKPVKGIRRKPFSQSIPCDDSVSRVPASAATSIWSNGDSDTVSPKTEASRIRDQKGIKDRPGPQGPSGRGEPMVSQSVSFDDSAGKVGSIDFFRPSQEVPGAAEQSEADPKPGFNRSSKRPRVTVTSELAEMDSSKSGAQLYSAEAERLDSEEAHHQYWEGGSIRAPLGVPFCPGSVGSARKQPFVGFPGSLGQLLLAEGGGEELLDSDYLPDGQTLQRQMDQIARAEGLEGVSRDCAYMLNQGLDIFLKRIIQACVDLGRSKFAPQALNNNVPARNLYSMKEAHLPARKLEEESNGTWTGHNIQVQGGSSGGEVSEKGGETPHPTISLLDFKVAMELNPQKLGEDWPSQLERISFRSFV